MEIKEEIPLESWLHLHTIFEKSLVEIRNENGEDHAYNIPVIYRGMKNCSWDLIPSVGRSSHYTLRLERDSFDIFKKRARPHLSYEPKDNWEWLTIAQHHGLPTRLLDWTENPLIATYFAVEDDNCENDGVVYRMPAPQIINTAKHKDPLLYEGETMIFMSDYITPRLVAQTGFFTVHGKPTQSINAEVEKIIIPQKLRNELKLALYKYGINRATLFPDLDGLAATIKWLKD